MGNSRRNEQAARAPLRARAVNALRAHADRRGLRLGSADEAVAYGRALSDRELAGVRNLGAKGVVWLRAQPGAPARPA